MTDRQKQDVLGRRLLNDKGEPIGPRKKAKAMSDAPPLTPEQAKTPFLDLCMAFGMSEAQAEAAFEQQADLAGRISRGEIPQPFLRPDPVG